MRRGPSKLQNNAIRILFLGDVVGPLGRKAVRSYLATHRQKDGIDFVIANGENVTHGHGLSYEHYKELLACGVDCLTSGNHFFNAKDAFNPKCDFSRALRPYNFDPSCPLKGTRCFDVNGISVRVTNLIGRVFINMSQSNPFYDLEKIVKEDGGKSIHIVDFHAEATAEKRCLAEAFDGRIAALFGTHTHVQTNDAKRLSRGTLFLTDAGMNGAYDSVLGDCKESSIRRTMTGLPAQLDVPRIGRMQVNGVLFDIDINSHRAVDFRLVNELLED